MDLREGGLAGAAGRVVVFIVCEVAATWNSVSIAPLKTSLVRERGGGVSHVFRVGGAFWQRLRARAAGLAVYAFTRFAHGAFTVQRP
jgi:hypothetical protein